MGSASLSWSSPHACLLESSSVFLAAAGYWKVPGNNSDHCCAFTTRLCHAVRMLRAGAQPGQVGEAAGGGGQHQRYALHLPPAVQISVWHVCGRALPVSPC